MFFEHVDGGRTQVQTDVRLDYEAAVDAAIKRYEAATRHMPDEAAITGSTEGLTAVEVAEIEAIEDATRARGEGRAMRWQLIVPFWMPQLPFDVRCGKTKAIVRLLAAGSNSAKENKELTSILSDLLATYEPIYDELLVFLERNPRLRTPKVIVKAISLSGDWVNATYLGLMRAFAITWIGVALFNWQNLAALKSVVGYFGLSLAFFLWRWWEERRKTHSQRDACSRLLTMLEQVDLSDPKTRREVHSGIRELGKPLSGQKKSIREQVRRLMQPRRGEIEGLPIASDNAIATTESLPTPSAKPEEV